MKITNLNFWIFFLKNFQEKDFSHKLKLGEGIARCLHRMTPLIIIITKQVYHSINFGERYKKPSKIQDSKQ